MATAYESRGRADLGGSITHLAETVTSPAVRFAGDGHPAGVALPRCDHLPRVRSNDESRGQNGSVRAKANAQLTTKIVPPAVSLI